MAMESLHGYLLSRAWPATHVLAGLRVSRLIRLQLLDHVERVVFSCEQVATDLTREQIAQVIGRFRHRAVSFALRIRCADTARLVLSSMDSFRTERLVMLDLDALTATLSGELLASLIEGLSKNTCLTSLALNNVGLGNENFVFLSAVLECRSLLTRLELSRNTLGDMAATAVSRVLKANSNITHLNLAFNKFGPLSTEQLVPALCRCTSLQHLNLGTNYLFPQGVELLSDALRQCSTLTSLNLSDNSIGPSGALQLASALEHCRLLRRLDLKNNGIGSQSVHALSGKLRPANLTHVDLQGNRLGDDGAAVLGTNLRRWGALQRLSLALNGIGPSGAQFIGQALESCSALTDLDMSENPLRAVGTGAMGQAAGSGLERLSLAFTHGGDDGLRRLAEGLECCGHRGGSGLKWLSLRGCGVGDEGVAALLRALRALPALQHLDLGRNQIRDAGAGMLCVALAPSPADQVQVGSGFRGLTGLDLSGNEIRAEGGRLLRNAQQRARAAQETRQSCEEHAPDSSQRPQPHCRGAPNQPPARVPSSLALARLSALQVPWVALVGNDVEPRASRGVHKQCSMPVYY